MVRRPVVGRVLLAVLLAVLQGGAFVAAEREETCSGIVPMKTRGDVVSIADFGGVGDGQTLNTAAFESAVSRIEQRNAPGGTLLYIPAGVWLTGAFNLTSHMTLFLAKGAIIKATQDTSSWPLIDPLPSYGRGRELPGGRYMSLIHGNGLHDVIITGENGTIDGQGDVWWNMWRQRTLRFTRPNLLELMHSTDIIMSNLVFQNSPFWNIHPVYCRFLKKTYVLLLSFFKSTVFLFCQQNVGVSEYCFMPPLWSRLKSPMELYDTHPEGVRRWGQGRALLDECHILQS